MLTTEKIASGGRDQLTSRNSRPLILVGVVALLCGLTGVGLQMAQKKPVPAPKLTSVPVAVRDLDAGRIVQSSDFYMIRCSPEQLAKLPVRSFYSQGKEIVGRIVHAKVAMGAPFSLDSLYAEGTGPSPVDNLASGYRGVTVGVKLVGGVRGFASPNAWVDVLFRRDDVTRPRSIEEARTQTLFRTVQVLAVEDQLYPDSQLPRDLRGKVSDEFEITLGLTPEQAEVIKTLEGRGTISLSLLPPESGRQPRGDLPSPGVLDLLLGVVEPEREPPAPPAADRVEMYRGGQSNVVELQPGESIAPASEGGPGAIPQPRRTPIYMPAQRLPVESPYYYEQPTGPPMGAVSPHETASPTIAAQHRNQSQRYAYSSAAHPSRAQALTATHNRAWDTNHYRPTSASHPNAAMSAAQWYSNLPRWGARPEYSRPQAVLASNQFSVRR